MRAPYTRNTTTTDTSLGSRKPKVRDIDFVAGDTAVYTFLFKDVVWTETRPEDEDGLPMYHASETVPVGVDESPTALVAPWVRKVWHSHVRDSYVSSVRYYNGWVPWYGMRPDWVWWKTASLAARFTCTSSYSVADEGTVVVIALPDERSKIVKPHKKYRWDLESAEFTEYDTTGTTPRPTGFFNTRTWLGGRCTVYPEWTL